MVRIGSEGRVAVGSTTTLTIPIRVHVRIRGFRRFKTSIVARQTLFARKKRGGKYVDKSIRRITTRGCICCRRARHSLCCNSSLLLSLPSRQLFRRLVVVGLSMLCLTRLDGIRGIRHRFCRLRFYRTRFDNRVSIFVRSR